MAGAIEVELHHALSCPQCDYNLTGLTQARCPECGHEFDWEQLRRDRTTPTIAFERAFGRRMIGGFLVTWLTVMFAPWVFAQQISRHFSQSRALWFGAICFCSPWLHLLVRPYSAWVDSLAVSLTWFMVSPIFVLVESLLLTLLDPVERGETKKRFQFWLSVSLYTSAVMLLECYFGPPPLEFDDVIALPSDIVWWALDARFARPQWLSLPWDPFAVFYLLSLISWLAGLGCVVYVRLRRLGWSRTIRGITALITTFGWLGLYSLAFEFLGGVIYEFFEDLL